MNDALLQFLAMGGYGFYVWLAYLIASGVLVMNIVLSVRQHKQSQRQIMRRIQREAALASASVTKVS